MPNLPGRSKNKLFLSNWLMMGQNGRLLILPLLLSLIPLLLILPRHPTLATTDSPAANDSEKSSKRDNNCIWDKYALSDAANLECVQLWQLYEPVEVVDEAGGHRDWVVLEKIFNRRTDRTMKWEEFYSKFGFLRQPGLVSFNKEFRMLCFTSVVINSKNGLIGAAKSVESNDAEKLKYFLWVYWAIDANNGDIYQIKDLLEGKYGTKEFSNAILKKAMENDFQKIQHCFRWTGDIGKFIQAIRLLKDQVKEEKDEHENGVDEEVEDKKIEL